MTEEVNRLLSDDSCNSRYHGNKLELQEVRKSRGNLDGYFGIVPEKLLKRPSCI